MKRQVIIVISALIISCSKEDTVLIVPDIQLSETNIALLSGQTTDLDATYFEAGVDGGLAQSTFEWSSSNPAIATVNNNGLVTGVATGSTQVVARSFGYESVQAMVSVVQDSSVLARIELTANSGSLLMVDDSLTLTAHGFTLREDDYELVDVTYLSSDQSVLTVDASGVVQAIGEGAANVTASANGVSSEDFTITIAAKSSRTTQLDGDHYQISGEVTLEVVDGQLILTFGEDFSSQNGPGLYIYLSNSTDGTAVIANGIELGPLPQLSGAFEINVSESFPNVGLNDFAHVIVYCKPFTVTFGYGTLD